MKPDITTEDDIQRVVDTFYGGIEADPLLGPFFAPLDMAAHLPRMYRFWSSIVFHTGAYRGSPFLKHAALEGLGAPHFARWVERFHATVDAHFAGERAAYMKQKAQQIATVFQLKLKLIEHRA